MTKPKPPRPRRKAPEKPGAALKRSILATYELDPAELLLLDQAGELLDQLARINAELAGQPLTTAGSRDQVREHPLLESQRRHSEALARVLDALHLPMDGETEGETLTTKRARKAAQARWDREKGVG